MTVVIAVVVVIVLQGGEEVVKIGELEEGTEYRYRRLVPPCP